MTKEQEEPESAELAAMHVEDDGGVAIDDRDWIPRSNASPADGDADLDERAELDIADGVATERDMRMAEDELEDQGEITAADQQFGH